MEGFGLVMEEGLHLAMTEESPESFFSFAVSIFFLEYLHSRSVTKVPWLQVVRNGP